MKQIFPLVAALLLSIPALLSQNTVFNDFIEQHKRDEGFSYAFLSKDLFEVTTKMHGADKEWQGLQNLVKNIGSLSILAGDSIQNSSALYKDAKSLVMQDAFDELLTVRDDHARVHIWAKTEDATVTDLVLLASTPEDFVLVCFAGKLELNNIFGLAELFEAGASENLARMSAAASIEFQISPNPASGSCTLSYDDQQDPPASLSVINQSGRLVATLNLAAASVQQVSLPDLPSGVYWLQLKTRTGKVGIKQLQIQKK